MISAKEAKELSNHIDMTLIESLVTQAAAGGLMAVSVTDEQLTQPRIQLLEKLGYELTITAKGYMVSWKNVKDD